jgi:two-component system cell cycle response regulator
MPHVLLVEDYADNRVLISELLDAAGMACTAVPDGKRMDEALAGGLNPDLFLLDISLPGEDGNSILARLRLSKRFKDRPIVALTAHAMSGDREKGLAAGFDGYLTKPIDVPTFADEIRRYLQEREEAL